MASFGSALVDVGSLSQTAFRSAKVLGELGVMEVRADALKESALGSSEGIRARRRLVPYC